MKFLSQNTFLIVSFLLLYHLSFAQDAKALLKSGDKLYRMEHYRKALPYLEKAIEAEPNNAKALFEAGVCYLHRYSKEKALSYLLKSYSLDSNVSDDVHYWLGRAYHQSYQYENANKEYSLYKNSLRKLDSKRKDVDKSIVQNNVARELTNNPENYRAINLGEQINTIYSEHSPVTSSNDSLLMFTSRRKKDEKVKEDYDGEYYEDILQTRKQVNGEWSTPEHLDVNTTGHDASIQLFDNDNKMLIYREAHGGDIYITEIEQGNTWKTPEKFANINTGDFESDAYITSDGKTAYYASNHYKKTGDLDIYVITQDENGKWSKPQELNGDINTPEDDDAPFLSPDGKTLYFSSRGHKNMGGYDIFKSTLDSASGQWSKPVNLGFPINTPDDDVYYYISPATRKVFISSYREGGYGEKDIYEVAPVYPVNLLCNLNSCEFRKRDNLKIDIKSTTKETKNVSVSGKFSDNHFDAQINSYNSYHMVVYNSKDTLYKEDFEVPFMDSPNQTIEKNIEIPCDIETEDSIDADSNYIPKFVFRDLYFVKGTPKLTAESKRELDIAAEILKKNPTAEVFIKGSVSREEPKSVAYKRAKVIQEELIARGITNAKISEKVITNGVGTKDRSSVLDVKLNKPLSTNFDQKIIPPYTISKYYIARNINFETAKANLNWAAKMELDVLYKLLVDYPTIKMEIAGHTDSRGPDSLNQQLSEKRAKAAISYIIKKGINPDRVTAVGYGETQPLGDNNTPEGRLLNRRTEFRITRK